MHHFGYPYPILLTLRLFTRMFLQSGKICIWENYLKQEVKFCSSKEHTRYPVSLLRVNIIPLLLLYLDLLEIVLEKDLKDMETT